MRRLSGGMLALVLVGAGLLPGIGVAQADCREDLLMAALDCFSFSGDLERAGRRGASLLFEVIETNHEKRRAIGVDYPEVDICRVWSEVEVPASSWQLVQSSVPSVHTGVFAVIDVYAGEVLFPSLWQ